METVEQLVQVFRLDARAWVFHGDMDAAVRGVGGDLDGVAGRCVSQRIRKQIAHRTTEEVTIGVHADADTGF